MEQPAPVPPPAVPPPHASHGVAVVAGDERPAGRAQRIALGAATVCFALVVFGFGVADRLLPGPGCAARAQVVARAAELAPSLAPAWLDESPPPVAKHPVPPAMLALWTKVPQLMFLCEINETLLRALWQPGSGLTHVAGPDAPRQFDVFAAPGGGVFPRYRYPPSTTMPDGLTTNRFGFRGPDLALDKPARTVRIACVGASTTVDSHHFAWSYPELLQHWLDRWAAAKGLDLHFEVINAGREAITSADLRAIVEFEVLPLAVDYVVYYEGANQCGLSDLLRHVQVEGQFTPAAPPHDLPQNLPHLAAAVGTPFAALRTHSPNLRRLLGLSGFGKLAPEPPKPDQSLQLPAGLDPQAPDLARANEFLQLGAMFGDLDAIHAACTKVHTQFVLASFCWLVDGGLQLDLTESHSVYAHLNSTFWPLRYDLIRQLTDLQNRFFAAWATARGVPFLDLANDLPRDPALYIDVVHASELGSRLRAWLTCAGLVRQLEKDLAAGVVPVPDPQADGRHPFLQPAQRLTATELDRR